MPTFDILAKSFDVQHDVDDAFSAASWSINYEKILASGVFDPYFFNNVKIYHGEASPDKVRIKVKVDGEEQELILGVVDRNGWTDRDGGVADGTMSGRDLMAFALDKTPATGFVIAVGQTFKQAVEQVAEAAGLSVNFFCDDYTLARAIPVTVDKTYGSVLQDLLVPFRWSEKSRVDAWVDGEVLTVAQRNYSSPPRGIVTMKAERMVTNKMEKSRNIKVDDVKVDGGRFSVVIILPSIGSGGITRETKTFSTGQYGAVQDLTTWTEETEIETDSQGREIRSEKRLIYLIKAGKQSTRMEFSKDTKTFYDTGVPDSVPYKGKEKDVVSYREITDAWPTVNPTEAGTERIEESNKHLEYYIDNGDTKSEETVTRRKIENPTKAPSKWASEQVVEQRRWRRSGGQLIQEYTRSAIDLTTGGTKETSSGSQMGPFEIGSSSDPVAGKNEQILEGQYTAGPTTYIVKMRREQSDLLDNAGCALIRGYLLDENTAIRVGASFRMPFDPRIKAGKLLIVQGAPSWWPLTSFYITAVRATASDGLDCDLECVAWL